MKKCIPSENVHMKKYIPSENVYRKRVLLVNMFIQVKTYI